MALAALAGTPAAQAAAPQGKGESSQDGVASFDAHEQVPQQQRWHAQHQQNRADIRTAGVGS